MREIPLTKGYVALVDDEDYEWVSQHEWCVLTSSQSDAVYAQRHGDSGSRGGPKVLMHREIMGATGDELVSHRNLRGLDNQKLNLRKCNPSQIRAARRVFKNNRCGMKGVSPNGKGFSSTICFNGKRISLGTYPSIELAAAKYLAKAKELYGDFARV